MVKAASKLRYAQLDNTKHAPCTTHCNFALISRCTTHASPNSPHSYKHITVLVQPRRSHLESILTAVAAHAMRIHNCMAAARAVQHLSSSLSQVDPQRTVLHHEGTGNDRYCQRLLHLPLPRLDVYSQCLCTKLKRNQKLNS